MKRLLILLLFTAVLLTGCANFVESTRDSATRDEATADHATRDEATTDQATADSATPDEATEAPAPPAPAQLRYEEILSGKASDRATLDRVTAIPQYPDMQAACESMALTAAINHFGYNLGEADIVNKYLVYDDTCVTGYSGNPRVFYEGAGIFPPGLVTTTWNFINDRHAALYPFDTTGLSMDDLYKFIDAGCPVLIWTTVERQDVYFEGGSEYNGVFYPWFPSEHCVCLYGYDKSTRQVLVADSWYGTNEWEDAGRFEELYNEIGKFSMVIMDTSGLR